MGIAARRRLITLFLFLSLVSFIPGIPASVRIGCGILQGFYLPGFAFFLLFWNRTSPSLDELFIPVALSPVVFSLLVAAVFMLTRSLGASVLVSVLVLCVIVFGALARRKTSETDPRNEFPRALFLIPLLLCAMVGTFYMLNSYLLADSDAFVHAPVVGEIIDHGIPPAEPRLPHVPIRYPWFYHLFAASFVKLTGLSVFGAFGFLNVMNALVFPYLIVRITGAFTRKRIHLFSTPIFAIAGLSSASWILWPIGLLRVLRGEVRGSAEIARILGEIDLNSYRVVYFLTPHWMLMTSVIDKLLVITPFTYATNLFLLTFLLALSRDFQEEAPIRAGFTIAFMILGTFLIHVVTGVVLMLAAAGGGTLLLARRLWRRREELPRFQTMAIPALAVVAGIVGLPYFRSLTGGGGERILVGNYVHFGFRNLITICTPFVGLAFVMRPLLRYLLREAGVELKLLSAWLVALFFVNLCIVLPGENEAKFVALFFMLLVVPASIVLVDWLASASGVRRVAAIVWIAVLFLVPPVLTARGFLLQKPETDVLRMAYRPGNDRMQLYDWIRTRTSSTSVVMELNTQSYTPLYAHRHAFIPFGELTSVLGYTGEKIERYESIQRDLFSSRPFARETMDSLRDLGRDVYVILWREDVGANPYLDGKFRSSESPFRNVYENPSGVVYRLERASGHQ